MIDDRFHPRSVVHHLFLLPTMDSLVGVKNLCNRLEKAWGSPGAPVNHPAMPRHSAGGRGGGSIFEDF